MKKIVSKLKLPSVSLKGIRPGAKRAVKPLEEPSGRITTDTLAEHREKVLAGGRKFKYPMQYARYRLVINTIIISVASLVLLVGLGWYLLYPTQNTSEFMYHVTKVIPVPVAVIDGQQVRYSDYLMRYRSNVHYLVEKEQVDITTKDGKEQLAFVKSQAMNDAIADAYAAKLAKQQGLEVTDADFESFLKQQRQSSDGEVSEATYNTVIKDYYDWSPDEYRQAMMSKLLRQKVAYAVDTNAQKTAQAIEDKIKGGATDMRALADQLNAVSAASVTYTPAAWVPKNNQDGGLATAAAKLQKGQISTAVKTTSGNGYYYVQLVDSNDTQLQYALLYVPLTTFNEQVQAAKKNGKLTKYISVNDVSATTQQ